MGELNRNRWADHPGIRKLRAKTINHQSGDLTISITTENLSRVDVYLDKRPIGGLEVNDGDTELTIEDAGDFEAIFLQGFDDDEFAAAWRITG